MEPKVQETFDVLFQIPDNKICFECNYAVDQWVSVTNGIFLCDKCAAQHKIFTDDISITKHILNDTWTEEELAMMRYGGNAKLKDFFDIYNIAIVDTSLGFKYCTKAGYYYRKQLKALAQGKIFTDILNEDEAMNLEVPKESGSRMGYDGNNQDDGRSDLEKFDNFVEGKFDAFMEKTMQVAGQVTDKISDPEFIEGVKQDAQKLGTTIVNGTVGFAHKVNDTLMDPDFQQNVKEVGGILADGAKKGLMSAFGFFSKLLGEESSRERFEEENYDTVYRQEDYGFGDSERNNDKEQVHEPSEYPVVRLKDDDVKISNKTYEVDSLDM